MYDFAWRFALKWEGGLDDDPDDPGGVTKYGVDIAMLRDMENRTMARAKLQSLGVRLPICRASVVNLNTAQAAQIYKFQVWDSLGCNAFPLPVACVLFDAGVNSGNAQSVKFLQRAHNIIYPRSPLDVDGKLGPKTRMAILQDDAKKLAERAIERREYFFRSLVKVKPKMKKFLNGWLNRCADLRKTLGL